MYFRVVLNTGTNISNRISTELWCDVSKTNCKFNSSVLTTGFKLEDDFIKLDTVQKVSHQQSRSPTLQVQRSTEAHD